MTDRCRVCSYETPSVSCFSNVSDIDADTCRNVCLASTYRTNQINSIGLLRQSLIISTTLCCFGANSSDTLSYSPFVFAPAMSRRSLAAVSREHRQIGQRDQPTLKCSVEHRYLVVWLLRGDKNSTRRPRHQLTVNVAIVSGSVTYATKQLPLQSNR